MILHAENLDAQLPLDFHLTFKHKADTHLCLFALLEKSNLPLFGYGTDSAIQATN